MSDLATSRSWFLAQVEPALREYWGYGFDDVPGDGVRVVPIRTAHSPLAIRYGGGALLLAEPGWHAAWERLAATLSLEQLFSILGVYELARTTLPDGYSTFGPVWAFLASARTFRPVASDDRVEVLDEAALRPLPDAVYWHCSVDSALQGFAIRHKGRIAALATVWRTPEGFWEIGVDVLPAGQSRGQGRAVVSAATAWILERAPVAYYTTGAFNVPSNRTALSLGYTHLWTIIKRLSGPFVVPPGPLGRPLPHITPTPYWRDYPADA